VDHTQEVQQQTDSAAEHGQLPMQVSLSDVPDDCFGVKRDQGDFDALDSALLHFVQTLVPLSGETFDQWTWEERRNFLNWCLDEGILTIQDGRLAPVKEELVATDPLRHDTDEDAPRSAENAGFLRHVGRAKQMIAANPAISAKELGLNCANYAQTMKVFVSVHRCAKEGAEECSPVFQQDGAGTTGCFSPSR
jgi:hypothetical protein